MNCARSMGFSGLPIAMRITTTIQLLKKAFKTHNTEHSTFVRYIFFIFVYLVPFFLSPVIVNFTTFAKRWCINVLHSWNKYMNDLYWNHIWCIILLINKKFNMNSRHYSKSQQKLLVVVYKVGYYMDIYSFYKQQWDSLGLSWHYILHPIFFTYSHPSILNTSITPFMSQLSSHITHYYCFTYPYPRNLQSTIAFFVFLLWSHITPYHYLPTHILAFYKQQWHPLCPNCHHRSHPTLQGNLFQHAQNVYHLHQQA